MLVQAPQTRLRGERCSLRSKVLEYLCTQDGKHPNSPALVSMFLTTGRLVEFGYVLKQYFILPLFMRIFKARRDCDFSTNPGPNSCIDGGCNGGLLCDPVTGTVRLALNEETNA